MKLSAIFPATLLLIFGAAASATAQTIKIETDVSSDKIISLVAENADARKVFTELCEAFHKTCKISPDVHGTISLHLGDRTFLGAMSAIMADIGASFENLKGVYEIHKTKPSTGVSGQYHAMPPRFGTLLGSLDFENLDVRDCLRTLFKQCWGSYQVSPDVRGLINLHLKGTHLETALESICKQIGADWKIEDNIFYISKQK